MVMAQSLFMTLLALDREAEIDVVAPPGPLALTERMPEVRESFSLPVPHGRLGLGKRLALGRRLGARGYDRAIVLPSGFKSALVPALARIPVRTGYRGEWRYGLINDVRPLEAFETERNVRGYLALAPDVRAGTEPTPTTADGKARGSDVRLDELPPPVPRPKLVVDAANQKRLIVQLALSPGRTVVALAPGAAYGPSKRWPVEKYRALANRLVRSGHEVWVLGAPEDRELGAAVAHGVAPADHGSSRRGEPGRDSDPVDPPPGCHDLCGRTSLTDAVDLLGLAAVTVSNDSGLMHVAAAAGSHVVALYGPTAPAFAPPLTDQADIVYLGLDCSPCFARVCPLGHHRCLEDVSVDEVQRTVTRVLAGG